MISNFFYQQFHDLPGIFKAELDNSSCLLLQTYPDYASRRARLYFAVKDKSSLQTLLTAIPKELPTYCLFIPADNAQSQEIENCLAEQYKERLVFKNLFIKLKTTGVPETAAKTEKLCAFDFVAPQETTACWMKMSQLFQPACAHNLLSFNSFIKRAWRHQLIAARSADHNISGVLSYEFQGSVMDVQTVFKTTNTGSKISTQLLDKAVTLAKLQNKRTISIWYEASRSARLGELYQEYGFTPSKKFYYCFC